MRSEIKTMEQRLHKHMKAPGSLRASSRLRSPAWRVALLSAAILALLLAGCELFPSNASVFSGKKYAIVIGINDYIDPGINDLNYCVADANSIATMLTAAGWEVQLITAESSKSTKQYATKSEIENALANVPGDAASFLLYYSGHGSGGHDPDRAYLVPSDYNGYATTMISTDELASMFAVISAKNKTIILDSCYSGAFVDSRESLDAVPGFYTGSNIASYFEMFRKFGNLLARNEQYSSANSSALPLVISAAGWAEESLEPDPATTSNNVGHGYFTYYLLEAASKDANSRMKGDADGDNVLSCLEAYSYAKTALESSGYDFLPHISGGLRDFALIDNRGN